jgi:hypothetical protein
MLTTEYIVEVVDLGMRSIWVAELSLYFLP